jgi:3'(2'), 5'-bisphosphate nucleotidase
MNELLAALDSTLPSVMRWAGAVAKRMRQFNIALDNKTSGSAATDALTLADLTVQELLVSALRDGPSILRSCRIEAEEVTGDLHLFAKDGPCTLALDPIDGTKQYRDRTGNGYSIIATLRTVETVHWSLVFIPESGPQGTWVHVSRNRVACGADVTGRRAETVVAELPQMPRQVPARTKKIYLIGFQQRERERAELVTQAGLTGVPADDCEGCLYELLARGEYAGSLIHTPNVYDFPVSLQIARAFGGDSVSVHDGRPVRLENLWLDERAKMLRLPNIIATSPEPAVRETLCRVAKDWSRTRYE